MEREAGKNEHFREKRNLFLEIARSEINPEITPEDIREKIIQHILTEDIFTNVFDDAEFHRSNNVVGDPNFGPDSALYEALGYVRKSDRKSGFTRKKKNFEVI